MNKIKYRSQLPKNVYDWLRNHNPDLLNMLPLKRDRFSREYAKHICSQFSGVKELLKNHPTLVSTIYKRKWTDLFKNYKYVRKWNRKTVIADAKRFNTSKEWEKNSRAAYSAATKNKWLKEATRHMGSGRTGKGRNRCVVNLDTGAIYGSISIASRELNIGRAAIASFFGGKAKTAGGYRWAYHDKLETSRKK